MHYDHVSFHTENTESPNLPAADQAARHIGFYYAWAVSQNLHSGAAARVPGFDSLKNGSLSGAEFVLQALGGGIDETCFNELGNRFTAFYYADEDEGYGRFMEDYFLALNLARADDLYRVADTPENRAALYAAFQAAFGQWQSSLKNAEPAA